MDKYTLRNTLTDILVIAACLLGAAIMFIPQVATLYNIAVAVIVAGIVVCALSYHLLHWIVRK